MYVGEVRFYAGQIEPDGWVFCSGQTLLIESFPFLYIVLGTKYGGDGISTFKLPDFSGRVVVHRNREKSDGLSHKFDTEVGGEGSVLLTEDNIPAHTHISRGSTVTANATAQSNPIGNIWGGESVAATFKPYTNPLTNPVHMAHDVLVGGGQDVPHNNMQPFLSLNFIIYAR